MVGPNIPRSIYLTVGISEVVEESYSDGGIGGGDTAIIRLDLLLFLIYTILPGTIVLPAIEMDEDDEVIMNEYMSVFNTLLPLDTMIVLYLGAIYESPDENESSYTINNITPITANINMKDIARDNTSPPLVYL